MSKPSAFRDNGHLDHAHDTVRIKRQHHFAAEFVRQRFLRKGETRDGIRVWRLV